METKRNEFYIFSIINCLRPAVGLMIRRFNFTFMEKVESPHSQGIIYLASDKPSTVTNPQLCESNRPPHDNHNH